MTTAASGKRTSAVLPEDELYEVINGYRVVKDSELIDDDDRLYEVIDGQRVEKVLGFYECRIATILGGCLLGFARANQLGRVVIEALFRLRADEKREYRPDVAFVSYTRWAKGRKFQRKNAWDVVFDLGVEIISPTNTAEEIQGKVHAYFQAGVQLVWVVYPLQQQVHVYNPPTSVRILALGNDLDGGLVLPGFRLAVADLFEDELEPEDQANPV